MAGGFDLTAEAVARSFCRDGARHGGDGIGVVHVGPQHRLAAVAALCGADNNLCALFHRHGGGLVHHSVALPVATDLHLATASGARGFERAARRQGDAVGFQHDLAALGD